MCIQYQGKFGEGFLGVCVGHLHARFVGVTTQ